MGWKPNHKPIREKYNPKPNAAEARHEARLREKPCFGCGRWTNLHVHHTKMEFPEKRWARDHRYQFTVCEECHMGPEGIHSITEAEWAKRRGLDTIALVKELWAESQAEERKAA